MIKRVSVKKLKIGNYVEKIDQSWFSTPFLFHQFKIKSSEDIQKLIDSRIEDVYINTEKGLDVDEKEVVEISTSSSINYIEVPVGSLIAGEVIPFSLYTKDGDGFTIYLKNNLPLHSEILYDIREHNIQTLYIDERERHLLDEYLKSVEGEKELSRKGLAKGFETQERTHRYNDYLNNYIPINPSILISGLAIPFPLSIEQDIRVSLFHEADRIFDEDLIPSFFPDYKKANILIRIEDKDKYQFYLKGLLAKIQTSEIKEDVRIAIIKENTKIVTKELLENPRSGIHLKEAKNSVNELIQTVLENPSSFYSLMRINTHDYYTYVHSVNVCTISIGIGMLMGLAGNHELFNLGFGALLHDIGKSMIDSSLINKPGNLTDTEFNIMKNHVLFGEKIIEGHKDIPEIALYPLKHHHEKISGVGYPRGLSGDAIHLFGRISAISDIYDALTTERAYKKALSPFDASNYLARHTLDYDQKVFKYFVAMLGKQERMRVMD
ncbi:MAG: DUF3391 domain-containing protein [Deltaproteobacteria bacterium]|nr:DUF3391 domain-containing protein [Deltaproteobacteria bacterium]